MKTLIQSKTLNVFTVILGLAALASSTEMLSVAPEEWRPVLFAIGMGATALSGVFVDMTAITGPATGGAGTKPFLPPKEPRG